MRNKAPLVMMEQLIMLLVFALAAALCVQPFVLADRMSQRCAARDRAVLEAQNAAEIIKGTAGGGEERLSAAAQTLEGCYSRGVLSVDYDENWQPVAREGVYRLSASEQPSAVAGLGTAAISVTAGNAGTGERDMLIELEVAWQEEDGRG